MDFVAQIDAMYDCPDYDPDDDDPDPTGTLQDDLYDFGEVRHEDMPAFQRHVMENPDEEMDDPDSASSGELIIDHKPQHNEPKPQDEHESQAGPEPDTEPKQESDSD